MTTPSKDEIIAMAARSAGRAEWDWLTGDALNVYDKMTDTANALVRQLMDVYRDIRIERDALRAEVERESKAASHWMKEANDEHNKNVKLEAASALLERALAAAEKFRGKVHAGTAKSVETYDEMTDLTNAIRKHMKELP